MWLDPETGKTHPFRRRAERVGFELPVRCKRGLHRTTVMLKDMTTHGARIEGLEGLHLDEPVTLFLPGLQPKEAYVAWSGDMTAGLEFDRPLHPEVFQRIVADFAVRRAETGPVLPAAA